MAPSKHSNGDTKNNFVSGYSVTSTAPLNVDDTPFTKTWDIKCLQTTDEISVTDIAKKLIFSDKEAELVIGVHGYAQGNTEPFWYQGIFDYFSQKKDLENNKNYVFLGYHWPSEKPASFKDVKDNFVSMPGTILGLLLFFGFFILSFCIILLVSEQKNQSGFSKNDVYFSWIVVIVYIVGSCFLLSYRHQHNNSWIEKSIDWFLWFLSGCLFFGFFHILHSQYNQPFLLLISIALSILLVVIILLYSKALDLLAPTLPVYLCIVIAVEFLSILPFKPILEIFIYILGFFKPILEIFIYILGFFKPILEIFISILQCLLDRFGTSLIIAINTFVIGIITALILLRFVAYFRDSYRANHFGVPDLVELIRQIDRALFLQKHISKLTLSTVPEDIKILSCGYHVVTQDKTMIQGLFNEMDLKPEDWNKSNKIDLWQKEVGENKFFYRKKVEKIIELELLDQSEQENNRVKLSFIGHSMGCFVITNTIRILSDVFDSNSLHKNPDSNIGTSFNLKRLILVAPDIPVETITSGRSNFLKSSLRRVKEAYIFSNEGDIVLRILSATANYFSFPTNERLRGSRLGILTVQDIPQNIEGGKRKSEAYGIVNYNVSGNPDDLTPPSEHLEIRDSGNKPFKLLSKFQKDKVADSFTYFDCTDYKDNVIKDGKKSGKIFPVVSEALGKPRLGIWEYTRLFIGLFLVDIIPCLKCRKIDVHGDYFNGVFTQKAIYEIAFLGLGGFLKKLPQDPKNKKDALEALSSSCKTQQIRVVLSMKKALPSLDKAFPSIEKE